ncbi:Pga1p Ecym_6389 [Eremothecium cymbalariae DBVPG|uniref:Protein PBN1 n=1 Tax=Eremothecium cymbalariae (strain CBS 270.75 / DBVPG 7215 / KCTC 17166 / NRRL Y-17582) TaxID=931890 RepID=G8JUI4_ERECY|nr:hypothetical protein Ecym_6389 [Eremothecium cymbalariae DBVPG\
MKFVSILCGIATVLKCIVANTEAFNLHIPRDFPLHPTEVSSSNDGRVGRQLGTHYFPSMSLYNINHKLQVYPVPLNDTFYIQLTDLKQDETYQIRICWTAMHPVNVEGLGYQIVAHDVNFQGTVADDARIFVHFKVVPQCYPPINADTIPINVSVVNIKMGIPVDLYSVVFYILLVLGAVSYLVQHSNPYQLLKNAR